MTERPETRAPPAALARDRGLGRSTLTAEARLNGPRYGSTLPPASAQGDVIPDARELHRVIAASVRELLETTRLERQAGMVDDAQLERVIFRAAAPPSFTVCRH